MNETTKGHEFFGALCRRAGQAGDGERAHLLGRCHSRLDRADRVGRRGRSLRFGRPSIVVVVSCLAACRSGEPYPAGIAAEAGDAMDADSSVAADGDAGIGTFAESGKDEDGDTTDGRVAAHFCDLPGSVRFTTAGATTVPGDAGTSDLSFLRVPPGYCFHWFGNVRNARQLRFAPGGELFVASPSKYTIGGDNTPAPSAMGVVAIMPDDDKDGMADATLTFLAFGAPGDKTGAVQGMLFANDHFYYQANNDDPTMFGTRIVRIPYASGDRAPRGPAEQIVDITHYFSAVHWQKTLDQADDGTIYVGNGGDQDEACDPSHPFHGGIVALDGTPGGTEVAKGFRNPIAVRCQRGKNRCFAIELGLDNSYFEGGREKLVPIRAGDDWGFPCCLAKGTANPASPDADCSTVAPDDVSFYVGSTPFGLDFEPGLWPSPYSHSVFVVLHGAVGNYLGARVVAISVDPVTWMPQAGDDLHNMMSAGSMTDFATGWDDETQAHGRPAAVAFAPDGRLFVANDNNGDIVWIAPLTLAR